MALLKLEAAYQHSIKRLLVIGMFVAGCNSNKNQLPFYNTADFTAEWIKPSDTMYQHIHTIDTFALYNQLGHVFTSDSLKGKIYLANFFFTTCPSICPKMAVNLKLLQQRFAKEPQLALLSFSVMPHVDSVGKLKLYGDNLGINPLKWHLLTGNQTRIYQLGRQSFFAEKKEGLLRDSTDFLHTENMLLIDSKSRIRGVYSATDKADIERVSEDIKTLINNQ